MSESLKDLTQKHKANALQKLDEKIQHLRLLQRLLQSQAQNFLETRLRFHNEAGLIISQVKLQKSHILATKHSNKGFKERITSDLKDHLDEDFLEGFNEVVEKKIALLRDRKKNKEIRGILLVLAKSQSRPIFFRLDYCFIHQKVEHPTLRSTVPQIILIAYTLSTIKREVFTKEDVSYFIKNGFDIFDIVPNKEKKLNVSSLIGRVASVTEAYHKKKSFLYKDLENVRLTYINQGELQKFNQGLRNFKQIRLALIYTKWQDGFEYFGTAFFYSETVLLTSFYNVTKRNGHQIKGVFICLKPKENFKWEEVNLQTQVTKVQQFAMIRILSAQNLKNRPLIQIDGSTQLSQHVDCLYIYGYQFQKGQDRELMFKQNVGFVQIGNHPSFDSYSKVKSKASIGSLCFTISDSRAIAFGVYNPLSKSVFDFDLFHTKLPKLIEALADKNSTQSQVIVDPLHDKRIQVDQSKLKLKPYSAIGMTIATNNIYDDKGRLKATSYSQGTGTFISQNIILTCGHNVFNTFYSQNLKIQDGTKVATQVSFYAGYSSTKAYTSIAQIVNNQKPTYSISSQNIYIHESWKSYADNNDLAILHLTQQNHSSHLDIKSTKITDHQFWGNTTLTICGYPGETYGKLRQHSGKALLNLSREDLLVYRIDTTTGNSGSAVISEDKFEIVAVHTNGSTANKINYGPLLVGENLEFIKERVRSLSENITSPVLSLRQIEKQMFYT